MRVSIVIPCYNEEGNIPLLHERLSRLLASQQDYEIIFVDDGSSDATLTRIWGLSQQDGRVRYISFSRNFGHQNALKAGLDGASGDCVISMDADLQHPPELIDRMLEKWREGYDIVYTIRDDSRDGNLFKKITSRLFYALINRFVDFKIERGAADFRLLDRRVVDVVRNFNESFLFFRGLMGWLGFRQFGISYTPGVRYAGHTKYSLRKMLSFALAGITSFSVKPLHFATVAGFLLSGMAALYALYAIYVYLFTNDAVAGWTSVLASVLFIGGFQLIILGIIGEYIGKMFVEIKGRPSYIVKESNMEGARPRRVDPV